MKSMQDIIQQSELHKKALGEPKLCAGAYSVWADMLAQALKQAGFVHKSQMLDEEKAKGVLQLRYFKLMHPDITESDAEIVANVLAKAICANPPLKEKS